ncbi:MAG: 1,4-alpha-glucan branching protein GlgB [Lachnospiraceae bacterium]|nr:1,4-alpha-glucan branching protein GlgB [Lachnospiraceae bacterium]
MAAKAGTETKKAAKKAPEKKAPAKRAAAKTTAPKKTTPEVFVSEEDCYLFGQGTHYDIYEKLGAHPSVKDGQKGYFFGVWAPNAGQVHVIGEFNGWNEEQNPMTKVGPVGIWTAFLPGVQEGQLYKFLITTPEGGKIYKADPYANWAELRPGTASRTADLSGYTWHDARWMEDRAKKDPNKEPMAIYECHVGSWMKHPDGTEDGFYTYREFADRLVQYLKEMKFTHVELMGILEHPFDGSWGYQVTGYYAPTSRYGSPKDFMYLVDTLHKAHVGVILDWVPAHFCPDAHGLAKFDGQCIYEDPDPRRGEHPDWGTKIFNLGKPEVKDFLIANVLYWIRDYHIDGIRVDAVASMLYLDYGKKDGQWLPNKYGGNKNLEAIEFFKHMNSVVRGSYPGFVTIAEESTAWPNVTSPIGSADGLGFSFKWNMGWMHDFCEYMKLDPVMRKGSHYNMTFAMSYNSAENYILPLSHDEVVHLKCSMLNKMPGYEVDKFANLRLGYTFMMGHAGKKLLFMGQEFAQEREWSEARELDWFLLQQPLHEGMRKYVAQLLKIYSKYPCMHEIDNDWAGFEWINADDKERSIYSFFRKCPDDKRRIMFILNMTPVEYPEYRLGVPELKTYRVILNSTDPEYGGAGSNVPKSLKAMQGDCDYKPQYITFDMPAYGGLVLEF